MAGRAQAMTEKDAILADSVAKQLMLGVVMAFPDGKAGRLPIMPGEQRRSGTETLEGSPDVRGRRLVVAARGENQYGGDHNQPRIYATQHLFQPVDEWNNVYSR